MWSTPLCFSLTFSLICSSFFDEPKTRWPDQHGVLHSLAGDGEITMICTMDGPNHANFSSMRAKPKGWPDTVSCPALLEKRAEISVICTVMDGSYRLPWWIVPPAVAGAAAQRQASSNFRRWYAHCNENPIYVFLFWELRGLSPNFHIHVSVSALYIPRIGPHISCSRIGRWIVGMY